MEKTLKCLRCGRPMEFLQREHLQLGRTGWILGDLDNLLAGGLDVAVLQCPGCGKLEFFRGNFALEGRSEETLAQVTCPQCGVRYDFDYPKCPVCGTKNSIF